MNAACRGLLFADAVGCSRSLLKSMESMIGSCVSRTLSITVPASESAAAGAASQPAGAASSAAATTVSTSAANSFSIQLDLSQLHIRGAASPRNACCSYVNGCRQLEIGNLTEAGMQRTQAVLAQQLELVLYTACKLDLQQLLGLVVGFIQNNNGLILTKLLSLEAIDDLISTRVLAAASSGAMKGLLMQLCAQRYLGPGIGVGAVFGSMWNIELQGKSLRFEAALVQPLLSFQPGRKVAVRMDFETSKMSVSSEGSPGIIRAHFGVVLGSEPVMQQALSQRTP